MKTTKLFFMAALALMTAACSNDDNEFAQQPQKAEGITITAQLAPKTNGAATRAVADNGDDKITVTWAENEHLAILYTVGSTKKVADATITGVDGSGTATISFTVDGGTTNDTPCTLVYPYSAAKDDHTGVKAYADLLATQDGMLDGDLDVRVGAGKIQVTTPSLDVTTQPEAQFSIFKFTIQNISAADKTATEFKVSDGSGNVMTTVTPGSASGELYVALPVMAAGTYWFNATIDSKPYIAKATTADATVAGKYYQTTVKMATIGDVILDNGKFAAPSSTGTKVAMIAYLGNDAETSPTNTAFKNGLALALEDISGTQKWCSQASATCLGTQYNSSTKSDDLAGIANTDALVNHTHTHAAASAARGYNSGTHPAGTSAWFLPSAGQWDKMIGATGLGLSNLGLQENAVYWSSTERDAGRVWYFSSSSGSWYSGTKGNVYQVRACLAF